jgi:hypothetical protein
MPCPLQDTPYTPHTRYAGGGSAFLALRHILRTAVGSINSRSLLLTARAGVPDFEKEAQKAFNQPRGVKSERMNDPVLAPVTSTLDELDLTGTLPKRIIW